MYGYYGGGIGALGWIILIAWLAILIFSAMQFSAIAEMKGHKGSTYFWWIFFTGPAGWVMVAALPDRAGQQGQTPTQMPKLNTTELPKINSNEMPNLNTTELPKL